jgi:hypothetical protein
MAHHIIGVAAVEVQAGPIPQVLVVQAAVVVEVAMNLALVAPAAPELMLEQMELPQLAQRAVTEALTQAVAVVAELMHTV